MNIKTVFLKVKLKSLMAESKIIRREEGRSKWNNELREQLHLHRVRDVRDEARATHLAYGFLRGKPYASMEHGEVRWDHLAGAGVWERVQKMVTKYGDESPGRMAGDLKAWRDHGN